MAANLNNLERALAAAIQVETDFEQELETLSEDASARRSIEWLAERNLLGWCVPAAFGGADTEGLAGPDAVSVQAVAKLRVLAHLHTAVPERHRAGIVVVRQELRTG